MTTPKLSIIVPVYNTPEQYYLACLHSLSVQNCKDVEFIIINDGSTFAYCEDVAKQYQARDSRFRYIYKANGGVSSARNLGIELSKGNYIMFVDADDIISPDCCEYVLPDVEKSEFDCILYKYIVNGTEFPQQQTANRVCLSEDEIKTAILNVIGTKANLFPDFYWNGPTAKIFRKSIITDYKLAFNIALPRGEDALFCVEFYQNCRSIVCDSKYIYIYINNSESVCRKPSDVVVRTLPTMCEAFSAFVDKYCLNDFSYQIYIGNRIWTYICAAERQYFFVTQDESIIAITRKYYQFLRTPIIRKYLKYALDDTSLSLKCRLAVYLLSSFLCVPYMVVKRALFTIIQRIKR